MTRYEQSNIDGVRVGKHVRVMCEALGIKKLPKNLLVHHIDGDKKNNSLDNLCVLSYFAHNKIHSHTAWNKGISAKDNEKWNNAIIKAQESRDKKYLPILREYYEMFNSGISVINIGKKFNKKRQTIYSGIKKYEQIISGRNKEKKS